MQDRYGFLLPPGATGASLQLINLALESMKICSLYHQQLRKHLYPEESQSWEQWLTPVIPLMWKAKIKWAAVLGQSWEKVGETLS
jgi:hypothetical protein